MMRILAAALLFIVVGVNAQAETMRLAVTTSFHNSVLSDVLLPAIRTHTGLEVQLLVVGTGQAIRLGEAGDVDAILVHSKAAEEDFVTAGFGTHRREIMYNDFVLIGPRADPAKLREASGVASALDQIQQTKAPFISRGNDSSTHKKERALWGIANHDPATFGRWYKEVGAGMGANLNTAAAVSGYIMADRASWLNFGNKQDLALLFSGDPLLFNQYAYIPVSPLRHGHIKADAATRLEGWLTSAQASSLINGYTIAVEILFTFNASP